jgi:hypothetical protein
LKGKLYLVDFTTSKVTPETCLVAKSDKGWLWHHWTNKCCVSER